MRDVKSATEIIVGTAPVTIRRRVKWGECDPAGVVHMVNYSEYVVSAFEMFMAILLEEGFQKAKVRHGLAMPARALTIEFYAPLRPDDDFLMTVEIADIRTKTFDVSIRGRSIDRRDVFFATLTPITVDPFDQVAVPLPQAIVDQLQHYRKTGALEE